jgi:hypothetical protein
MFIECELVRVKVGEQIHEARQRFLGKFDRLIPLGINAYILIHFNNNW